MIGSSLMFFGFLRVASRGLCLDPPRHPTLDTRASGRTSRDIRIVYFFDSVAPGCRRAL